MNCPKCNYDNADNALFCASCGTKLEFKSAYSLDAAVQSLNDTPAEETAPVNSDAPVNDVPVNPELPVYGAQEPDRAGYPTYTNTAPAQTPPPAQNFPAYSQQPVQPQQPQYNNNAAGSYQPQPYGNNTNYSGILQGQQRDWAAITALVCGILSLPCCFTVYGGVIVAVAAIVFGILGLKSSKKSMAIVGLILGIVGLICSIIVIVMVATMMKDPYFMNEFMTEFENAMNL